MQFRGVVARRERDLWFVVLAGVAFAASALLRLAHDVWTTEQGAGGPIILVSGLWLLWREARDITVRPVTPNLSLAVLGVLAVGAPYLFAAIIGKLWMQWACAYLALVLVLTAYVSLRALKRVWFPLLYLAFLIPPPDGIIVPLTRALKLGVASSAVELLSLLGFRVAFNGAQLYIDNYELVVAAACSGLNSLSSLLAIGLLYIYLRYEASWRYAVLLSLLVIPVAIVTNVVRVMVLLLVTHYLGEDAAQGMLHEAAGLLMFFVALFALIGIDALLMPIYKRLNRPAVLS